VVLVGEMINAHRVLVGNMEGRGHMKDVNRDRKVTLKLRIWGVKLWT
jgi:hypothetical protein